ARRAARPSWKRELAAFLASVPFRQQSSKAEWGASGRRETILSRAQVPDHRRILAPGPKPLKSKTLLRRWSNCGTCRHEMSKQWRERGRQDRGESFPLSAAFVADASWYRVGIRLVGSISRSRPFGKEIFSKNSLFTLVYLLFRAPAVCGLA